MLIDAKRLRETIAAGRVYQQENFLNEEQIQVLLNDLNKMIQEKKMVPSGLSNTNKGKDQNFGESDRMTCALPWWVDSLKGSYIESGEDSIVLNNISDKIQELRREASSVLNRPTMSDAGYEHECYYSRSSVGASLAR